MKTESARFNVVDENGALYEVHEYRDDQPDGVPKYVLVDGREMRANNNETFNTLDGKSTFRRHPLLSVTPIQVLEEVTRTPPATDPNTPGKKTDAPEPGPEEG